MVLAHALRRRPRQQSAGLAVGGGVRRRRGALLSHFQPGFAGRKVRPDGAYVRGWVPELANLPAPRIHAPWRAPGEALAQAGIALGRTYPLPIVDHAHPRPRAR